MDKKELARHLVKIAGQIMGPGIPDGTGPVGPGRHLRRRQMPCPLVEEEVIEEEVLPNEEMPEEVEVIEVASELTKIAKALLKG